MEEHFLVFSTKINQALLSPSFENLTKIIHGAFYKQKQKQKQKAAELAELMRSFRIYSSCLHDSLPKACTFCTIFWDYLGA